MQCSNVVDNGAGDGAVYDDLWRPVFLHLLVARGTSSGQPWGQAACIFHELVHIKVKCTKRTLPTWPASHQWARCERGISFATGRISDVCCLMQDLTNQPANEPTDRPRGCVCSCRHINRFVTAKQNIPKIKCKKPSSKNLTTRKVPCRGLHAESDWIYIAYIANESISISHNKIWLYRIVY